MDSVPLSSILRLYRLLLDTNFEGQKTLALARAKRADVRILRGLHGEIAGQRSANGQIAWGPNYRAARYACQQTNFLALHHKSSISWVTLPYCLEYCFALSRLAQSLLKPLIPRTILLENIRSYSVPPIWVNVPGLPSITTLTSFASQPKAAR